MPMTLRFSDGAEFDFDELVENGFFNSRRYVDETTRMLPNYDYTDGPGHHCDECGREYGMSCEGPRKYEDLWLCVDCKRWHFKEDHGLNDNDLGIGEDEE